MPSRGPATRVRKRPGERRDEILSAAAAIALEEGLERITLRAVAERLGVRPGLITHYFPAAEQLVVEAFVRAAVIERERFFPADDSTPVRRLARFIAHIESGASTPLARMWLNARHLSRFSPSLNVALDEQDRLDRARLLRIVDDGIASGDFPIDDAESACVRILIAVDGSGSYVNSDAEPTHPAHVHVVADVAEWALGMQRGMLRVAVAELLKSDEQ